MANNISAKVLQKLLLKGGTKLNPALAVAGLGIDSAKVASREIFGFDFVNLGLKLLVYFTVALILAKVMEAIVFARGSFVLIANLLGFSIPKEEQLPQTLKDLFNGGIKGFKFWDLVKVIAILLVITEMIMYVNQNRRMGSNPSPMTLGVFTLIIVSLGITTVPELVKRLKNADFSNPQDLV